MGGRSGEHPLVRAHETVAVSRDPLERDGIVAQEVSAPGQRAVALPERGDLSLQLGELGAHAPQRVLHGSADEHEREGRADQKGHEEEAHRGHGIGAHPAQQKKGHSMGVVARIRGKRLALVRFAGVGRRRVSRGFSVAIRLARTSGAFAGASRDPLILERESLSHASDPRILLSPFGRSGSHVL